MCGAITTKPTRERAIIFNDTEKSNWAWDPVAGAYYWHRFFSHQPDLNYDNPRVLSAMIQIMRRWLDLGVDGFRLGAIPYLCEREGTNNENLPETHAIIKNIRAELDSYAPGKLLLAEANQWPEDVSAYFGDGDECHMAYHFPLMPRIYMAIAQEDRFPITDILRQTPDIPSNCQWALFLRNHDELTLEMVTDVERDYLWSTYATDPRARINLGIRRRLASLMDNDRRKIELMNSLLMSFPGTPIIYYGDEIGMGDNIYLGDRNGVRTPMQWTPDRNGGFSRCDPARLYLPMIMDPVYGYEAVNVEAQSRSLASLLSWTKRLISVRKSSKVFGRGSLTLHPPGKPLRARLRAAIRERSRALRRQSVALGAGRRDRPRTLARPRAIRIARANELSADRRCCLPCDARTLRLLLVPAPRTGCIDDRGAADRGRNSRRSSSPTAGDRCCAAVPNRYSNAMFFRHFLRAGAGMQNEGTYRRPISSAPYQSLPPSPDLGVALLEAKGRRETASYLLPLTIKWTRFDRERQNPSALAAVRRGPREGSLLDATADPSFVALLLENLRAARTIEADQRRIRVRADGEISRQTARSRSKTSTPWIRSSPTRPSWSEQTTSSSSFAASSRASIRKSRSVVF